MSKKYVIVSIVVAVIIAGIIGGYLYVRESANSQNAAEMERRSKTTTQQPTEVVEEVSEATNKGQYINYSSDVIAQTPGTKILFFHAPWCPQCRMLDSDINKTELPDNVTIIKVDYDSNQDLRQEYGVTLQTTLVMVDDTGKLVKKYVAYNEPSYQVAIKENLLDS